MEADMQIHWSLQDAKNQFSKVIDIALQGTPQVVTRRGVPVVVVVAAEQYALLAKKEQTDNGFAQFLLSMPSGAEDVDSGEVGQDYGLLNPKLREIDF